jgi:hypothetical protein
MMNKLMVAFIFLTASCSAEERNMRRQKVPSDRNTEVRRLTAEIKEDQQGFAIRLAKAESDLKEYLPEVTVQPKNGRLDVQKIHEGLVEYWPTLNLNGEDQMSITLRSVDPARASLRVELTVNVVAVNDVPKIAPTNLQVTEDQPLEFVIDVQDPDGDEVKLEIAEAPELGELEVIDSTTGRMRFTPTKNAYGNDSFKLTATDGRNASKPALFNLTLVEVNDRPVAKPMIVCGRINTPTPVALLGEDPGDQSDLVYSVATQDRSGPFAGVFEFDETLGLGTFDPRAELGFQGWDMFEYRVSDGVASSDNAPVHLLIYQDRFNASVGNTLSARLILQRQTMPVSNVVDTFRFVSEPTSMGKFEFTDAQIGAFTFTPSADARPGADIDLNFRVVSDSVKSQACSIKISLNAP